MNWMQRLSYIYSPEEIIQGVLNNVFDGSGPSKSMPNGGWAYQRMQEIGPVACDQINFAAGINAAAYKKMKILAEAAGCNWNPEFVQQPENAEPMVTPLLDREQEKPMGMPPAEID